MLSVIFDRIEAKVEEELIEERAGFRQEKDTRNMLCTIQVML